MPHVSSGEAGERKLYISKESREMGGKLGYYGELFLDDFFWTSRVILEIDKD